MVEAPWRSGNVERSPVMKELSKGFEAVVVAEGEMDQGLSIGAWSCRM